MENKINIDFNNADLVLEQFNKAEPNDDQKVLRLIPVSNFNEVEITDSNIENNSNFISNIFD